MSALSARDFFSPEQKEEIRQAIMEAELDTSGEIRVHIENSCPGEVLDHAAWLFRKLKMNQTEQRNGVLIYLALKNRRFAIIGDSGIHEKVGPGFWDDVKEVMRNHFRENRFTEGLSEAILKTGRQLKQYYPYNKGDINELPDDISFGDR